MTQTILPTAAQEDPQAPEMPRTNDFLEIGMQKRGPASSVVAVDERASSSTHLVRVEAVLNELFSVSTRIARLLDVRRLNGEWPRAQRESLEALLDEEDRLRAQLEAAGGPTWDSSRRWAE